MKRVSRNLGKKFSAGRKRRHREGIARAMAAGVRFGAPADPETHIEEFVCQLPSCGKRFMQKITKGFNPRVRAGRYCCQPHATRHTAIRRRKVPAVHALLHDHYVVKNMSTVEIGAMFGATHHAALSALRRVGIERRRSGVSRNTICTRDGCDKPTLKLKHPQKGYMYGTLCETHYWEHRRAIIRGAR
jgi:hypothetical protein